MDASAERAARPFDVLGMEYERAYGHLPEQHAALDWLIARLPEGARVLDIGCGTGSPTAARLAAAGFAVTGIDVSATMVELAARQVPDGVFYQLDVREFAPGAASFDAVCAFFPLLQMPRHDLDATLARIGTWIAPGGCLVLATVPLDVENYDMIWMGQQVRATSYPTEVYLERLAAAGLTVVHARESEFVPNFPGMDVEWHLFCLARRPGGPAVPAHTLCGPYPHPDSYRGPHDLSQAGWLPFEQRLHREDIAPVIEVLAGNERVLDVGGGSGAVVAAIAAEIGSCATIEPDADRVRSMRDDVIEVQPGRAEQLPYADASFDGVVATWMLHYADDPVLAVSEMARVCDINHPKARIVLVQGAPDNEVIGLLNRICAPIAGERPDHQGFLLAEAGRVLAARGFTELSFYPLTVNVQFPEGDPEVTARVIAGLWYQGHPREAEMRAALAEHLAGVTSLSDSGVMLVARPPRLEI
ncbi:methyltransferase domain-containing protein [Nocardia sp. NBC_01499]|uniref:class I SAM-dependent methyltransferase n=1 Tax=Nocardia sp. NBC_01499 TaxID=2903597 RepID=UPI00386ECF29